MHCSAKVIKHFLATTFAVVVSHHCNMLKNAANSVFVIPILNAVGMYACYTDSDDFMNFYTSLHRILISINCNIAFQRPLQTKTACESTKLRTAFVFPKVSFFDLLSSRFLTSMPLLLLLAPAPPSKGGVDEENTN